MTHAGQSVWENGLGQNVIFLGRLLRSLPGVDDVVFLNCGDQSGLPDEVDALGFGFRLVKPREATDMIDVAIEMSGGLDVEWLDYLRALGKKVVFHCCGQPYAALAEPTVFDVTGFFSRAQRCDEIWILPSYRDLMPMLRTLHRCPVVEVPYLWDATFLERRAAFVGANGFTFGYHALGAREYTYRALRVGIFEPNISVTKTCSIPMLIGDAAYRANPDSVAELHVLNSIGMKDHPTFSFLANSLDLTRAGKARFDQRHDFVGYVSQHLDAIVSHQWHHSQNYLYLDALHGGYPLIHNSPWLHDVGYFYSGFDVAKGAQRLIEASREHDANLERYRSRAQAFLARLSPDAAHNASAYVRRLLALTSAPQMEMAQ